MRFGAEKGSHECSQTFVGESVENDSLPSATETFTWLSPSLLTDW